MRKPHRLVLTAFPLIAIICALGCVSNASTPEFANATWVAINPLSMNIKCALAAAKGSLTLTATNTDDKSNVGKLVVKIKEIDPKTRHILGTISSSDGIYEDLKGTAYVKYEMMDSAGKGDLMFVAISDVSFDDFEIQFIYARQ